MVNLIEDKINRLPVLMKRTLVWLMKPHLLVEEKEDPLTILVESGS